MSTLKTNTHTHTAPRRTARLSLTAVVLVQVLVPPAVALGGAWFAETQIAHNVDGLARVAYIAIGAVLGLMAADNIVTRLTDRAHQVMYGRVYGPRSWSCEDCGRQITASQYTPYEAAVFEAHLADPAAHDCQPK